jgi:adenosylcobinamide-GDP ribazoletransferase
VRSLLIAVQFLTRLPSPLVGGGISSADLGRSMGWFPAVGILVGCIVAGVDFVAAQTLAPPVRAMLLVALLIAITGALHLDGLMDTCDAIFAFTTPERRMEIMHDSRVGSFAIAGAATVLLLKYAAILSLPADRHVESFIVIGAISRWAMVYATAAYPSARTDGLGHAFKLAVGCRQLALATLFALVGLIPAGLAGLAALLLAWLFTMFLARYVMQKISGLTGDTYGAICEATETLVAIALTPLWRFLPL